MASVMQILFYYLFSNRDIDQKTWFQILTLFLSIIGYLVLLGFYSAVLIRLYLAYYDIHYQILTGSRWKNVINISYSDRVIANSWFIQNKHKYGSRDYLIKMTWISYIIIAITFLIVGINDIVYNDHVLLYYFFAWMIFDAFTFIICVMYYFHKLKKVTFHDDFHVLPEFAMLRNVLAATMIFSLLYMAIFVIVSAHLDDNKVRTWVLINFYINYEWMCGVVLAMTYIMSRYVINKLKEDTALQTQYGQILNDININMFCSQTNGDNQTEKELKSVSAGKTKISLQKIMGKTEYLDLFMKHLAQEFSLELALSLIEFIQFKNYLEDQEFKNDFKIEDGDDEVRTHIIDHDEEEQRQDMHNTEFSSMTLCEDIPKSSIVYDTEHNNEWKARELYMKYIRVGSQYEININSAIRSELMIMFEKGQSRARFSVGRQGSRARNMDVDNGEESQRELKISPKIFVRCTEEMGKLLGYSLSRFKTKPDYVKLLNFETENGKNE